MNDTITTEEIQRHYSACLDSVMVINKDGTDADTVERNIEHLKIMLAKDFWTASQDLKPLRDAVK